MRSRIGIPLAIGMLLGSGLLMAADSRICPDLDGDQQPDLLRLSRSSRDSLGYLYILDIEMSSGVGSRSIHFHSQSPDGVRIVPRDIDGDHDIDLVITNVFDWRPLGVLVNDGTGAFTPGETTSFPWASPSGSGSSLNLPSTFSSVVLLYSFTQSIAPISCGETDWDCPPTAALPVQAVSLGALSGGRLDASRAPPIK